MYCPHKYILRRSRMGDNALTTYADNIKHSYITFCHILINGTCKLYKPCISSVKKHFLAKITKHKTQDSIQTWNSTALRMISDLDKLLSTVYRNSLNA